MNDLTIEILSYSILFPVLISLIRIKQINRQYYPFVLFVWIGFLSELISTILAYKELSNAPVANIYVLFEAILIILLFRNFNLFKNPKKPIILIALVIIFWSVETVLLGSLYFISSYYRIITSFFIVIISIDQVNKILVNESKSLLRNPTFLTCLAFIIFFTYKALIEIFWLYGFNNTELFRKKVYDILTIVNLISNLIYALVALWIPSKRKYSLLSL